MRALRLLLSSAVVLSLCSVGLLAAGSARSSYERALARERTLAARTATPSLAELRRLVASFERIAYIYPTSGYADNALQKAAEVAEQVYARTKAESDRAAAVRLHEWLAREYPTSPFARRARAAARALEASRPGPAAAPADTTRRAAAPPEPAPTPAPARASGVAPPVVSPAPHTPSPATPTEPVAAAVGTDAGPTASPQPAAAPSGAQLLAVRRAVLPEVVRITLELDGEVGYHHERLEGPARLFFDLRGATAAPHLRDAVLSWPDDVVRKVRLGRPAAGTTRVVLDLEGTRRYSVFTMYNPYRLVVDLERADGARAGLRPSQPAPRVTPDASPETIAAASVAEVTPATPVAPAASPLADIDLEPAPAAPPVDPREIDGHDQRLTEEVTLASRPVGTLAGSSAPLAPRTDRDAVPAAARTDSARTDVATNRPGSPPAAARAAAAPRPPAANATGGFSLSRQLGLGISRIVIDPGHGGRDPGAQANGLSEATLVLDVALRLEKLLAKSGVEVVLTRRTDEYVALEERTAIANRQQADLFLSIHANASRNRQAHGVETYFLNFATSPEAEAVAARENSASERTMHNLPDIVKAIATNNKLHESRDLAGMVQESMVRRLSSKSRPVRNLGVKQAPFVVLIGAAMPSVLAEISFVTNAREAQSLKTGAYRQRIAEALHEAVLKYQRSLKAVGTIAEQ